ncbi:hypothetical protein HM1_1884 [Heliomicrobium modesticaldum Ice1]|uniref:Uncharacterized protein n=1 Tax=Heliobacterium modesticaldum (strain ATCC 51547 / Ice1) TaxID=498761 RepID=B0TFC6_HELMI|nr:hypothetical protein HM1_1884 [Heliomicrobium modesticaldum Ice1]
MGKMAINGIPPRAVAYTMGSSPPADSIGAGIYNCDASK